jgi:drug/metabolite transporter (DMT)-like permease
MGSFKSSKTVDWSLVIIINFMWATQVPVIRLIGDGLGPITVAYLPLIISTLLVFPFLLLENKKRKVRFRWKWNDIKYFLPPGIIGYFIMQYSYTLGAKLTLAANAGIISLTIPILVAVFASIILKEKLNIVRVVGFFLGIAGVLMTSLTDISGTDFKQSQYLTGNLIFLFACGCCAFYNAYCKMLLNKQFTPLEIFFYSTLTASIVSIPLLIWIEPFHFTTFIHTGRVAVLGILEISIFVYCLSILLFFNVLHRMDITQAILGTYLLPFFIAVLGVFLLNEKITMLMLLGGGLILISTLLVTVYEKKLLAYFRAKTK